MPSIIFEHECWEPIGDVEVIANEDGTGILIIDKKTDDEIPFERLRDSDQSRIKARVIDWANHYRVMSDGHPADGAFGPMYVRGLNKDMGK